MQSTETEGYAHYTYTARKAIKTLNTMLRHRKGHFSLYIHSP
ncbi:hypothetical protein PORCRE_1617 [Porphyromonas crevioricanis JCM 15906]|uniref:Uncharacterized protein n=1 Tax=Porphyromonas crevioricanis JCM 15906 TaxID=1305617 RepID=T1CPY0_9PORP|nr:hypothetical protein PORCRE_1617 [Porphyromonas crevioricanis JCM 15906]